MEFFLKVFGVPPIALFFVGMVGVSLEVRGKVIRKGAVRDFLESSPVVFGNVVKEASGLFQRELKRGRRSVA